jgi:hypothetical protein
MGRSRKRTEQPRVLTPGQVVGKGVLKVASDVEHGGGTTHESAKRTTSVATPEAVLKLPSPNCTSPREVGGAFRACVLPGSPRAEALGCSCIAASRQFSSIRRHADTPSRFKQP